MLRAGLAVAYVVRAGDADDDEDEGTGAGRCHVERAVAVRQGPGLEAHRVVLRLRANS